MRIEEHTKNWRRLQVGMLLAGLVSPGREAGAADTQCPCDISVGVLERHGVFPSEHQSTSCHTTPEGSIAIITATQNGTANFQLAKPIGTCRVQIFTANGDPPFLDENSNLSDQQSSACEEDIRNTARALQAECPE